MKIKNSFLLGIGGIAFVLFLIWQLSLSFGFLQVIGAGIAIVVSAIIIKNLPKNRGAGEDDFIKAQKYAEEYVKNRTGVNITYIEGRGARRGFTDMEGNFIKTFAFGIMREGGMRKIPYLVVLIKEKSGRFEIVNAFEEPTKSQLDSFFGAETEWIGTWSVLLGHPKFAKIHGAPVKIREELYGRKEVPSQQINVGYQKPEDAEEKEKLGMKK